MFKVEIKQLKVNTNIGVSSKERQKRQLVLISIRFNYRISSKFNVNDIEHLQDYSKITKFVKNFVENSKYQTLEKLITETKIILKKKFRLNNIYLKIEKPEVAKKYRCSSISVSE